MLDVSDFNSVRISLTSSEQIRSWSYGEVTAVHLVSRQPWFKGVYLMTKPNGEFMVLNIWDTEAQANAWPQNPQHQQVVAQFMPLLTGAPMHDGYQVQAHTVIHG